MSATALLLLLAPLPARALGGTELDHVARRLAEALGTEARPSPFSASNGSIVYELGPGGADGVLLLSGAAMGHFLEPAEVPGHGGELLRIPQLGVGVRFLEPGLEPRCGAAVFEMQLDTDTRQPHASGLRGLVWADLDELPQACGVLSRVATQPEGADAFVFDIPVRGRRAAPFEPLLHREEASVSMVPGGFLQVGPLERAPIDSLPAGLPLLLDCADAIECRLVALEDDGAEGSELVAELAARLPDLRIVETDAGWGWTRVELEGPRPQVDGFLASLQEDERSSSLSAELVLRTGELAKATVRFRTSGFGGRP